MEQGEFKGTGMLIEVIAPAPYEFLDDKKEKRAGISYKAQLKFGRAFAEVPVTQDVHNLLSTIPPFTQIDVLLTLALTQDKKGFRPVISSVRPSAPVTLPNGASRTEHKPA